MYNYYALTDPRGLVPTGWHVPSQVEWNEMIEKLGGEFDASTKLKNKTGWEDKYNVNNKSGFSAIPGANVVMMENFHQLAPQLHGGVQVQLMLKLQQSSVL